MSFCFRLCITVDQGLKSGWVPLWTLLQDLMERRLTRVCAPQTLICWHLYRTETFTFTTPSSATPKSGWLSHTNIRSLRIVLLFSIAKIRVLMLCFRSRIHSVQVFQVLLLKKSLIDIWVIGGSLTLLFTSKKMGPNAHCTKLFMKRLVEMQVWVMWS